MNDRPITELFSVMVDWMRSIGVTDASQGAQPWRGELKTAKGYVLKVALNASKDPVPDGNLTLDPCHASIISDDIIAIAIISPYGGACGGVDENYLIEAFKAAAAPAAA